MRRRVRSIRLRLLLWLMVPLSAVTAAVAAETFWSARDVAWDSGDRTLLAAMLAVSENLTTGNGDLLAEETLEVLTESLGDQFFYHFSGPDNAFVTGYGSVPRPPGDVALEGGSPVFYDGTYAGDPVRVVAMRQLVTGRALNGWTTITTWQRVSQRDRLAHSLFRRSLARLILMLVATAAIVWFAVERGLEPLRDLQAAFARRSPSDLSPVRRAVPGELSGIVRTANDLFGRLRRSSVARERWVGDAAHQLKNPVAAVRARAETALRAPSAEAMRERLRGVVASADGLSRLTDQLLVSARLHSGAGVGREAADVVAVVREATLALTEKALARSHSIALDADGDAAIVPTDPILLREAVSNLLDNAIVHCPPGTDIVVAVEAGEDAITISVSDTGPGLPAGSVEELCAPFTSGAPQGTGLGLAIARDVATAIGATFELRPLSPTGTRASLVLPRASVPAAAQEPLDAAMA